MALYDRQENDAQELQKVRNFNKDLKNRVLETQAEDAKIISQMFVQNPELDNTLAKMVIVDSRGQHKDQRNSKRLESAQKLLAKQDKKEEQKQQKNWEQEQDEYYANKINLDKYLTDDE